MFAHRRLFRTDHPSLESHTSARGRLLLALLVSAFVAFFGDVRSSLGRTPSASTVRVEVVDLATRAAIVGARVFVLSEDGKELVQVQTGQDGLAQLPILDPGLRPKYLLVHHPSFYISGEIWRGASRGSTTFR